MPTTLPILLLDGLVPVAADFMANYQALADAIDALGVPSSGGGGGGGTTATVGLSGVRGLTGTLAGTMLAVQADSVAFRNAAREVIAADATGTITLDATVAGLNGRDQTAVFATPQILHAYFITNGIAIRTVLSDAAPPTGPDLIGLGAFSGYTNWAYIAPMVWHGASFDTATLRGCRVFLQPEQIVASSPQATTETAVSVGAFVPPTALTFEIGGYLTEQSNNTQLKIRMVTGTDYRTVNPSNTQVQSASLSVTVPNIGQQFYYLWTSANGNAGVLTVTGYTSANGDA